MIDLTPPTGSPPNALSLTDVRNTVATAFETWDSEVSFNIFGNLDTSVQVDGADENAPDGKNEIIFGVIDDGILDGGAIAVTIVWFTAIGRPTIVEFDMVFDDVDFDFGNADEGPDVMDLENIVAHEGGHALGLGHPDDACIEETMYRFASLDEILKRDLHTGDIAGINKVY